MSAATPAFWEVSDAYETWRAKRIPLSGDDVLAKYVQMSESPWTLARACYHRFVNTFADHLPELAEAPVAVSVGDAQIENFGTWRDRAGRLVWGVHGLEEVDLLPYTADLVRLASTARLAADAGLLTVEPGQAAAAILSGWGERIGARHPDPFVLGAEHADLYAACAKLLRDPVGFEREILALPPFERALAKPAARMLASITPPGDFRPELRRADSDGPHLGARRIIAVGRLDGGLIVRALQQVPGPVSMWAQPRRPQVSGIVGAIDAARGAAAEPWRRQSRKWVVRALDGSNDLMRFPDPEVDAPKLLMRMGAELANIHLTEVPESAARKIIRRDAGEREPGWLERAADRMAQAAVDDHSELSVRIRRPA